jgi:hypothetical protein
MNKEKIELEKQRCGERRENEETEDTIALRREMELFYLGGYPGPVFSAL